MLSEATIAQPATVEVLPNCIRNRAPYCVVVCGFNRALAVLRQLQLNTSSKASYRAIVWWKQEMIARQYQIRDCAAVNAQLQLSKMIAENGSEAARVAQEGSRKLSVLEETIRQLREDQLSDTAALGQLLDEEMFKQTFQRLKLMLVQMTKGQIGVAVRVWRQAQQCWDQTTGIHTHGLRLVSTSMARIAKDLRVDLLHCWQLRLATVHVAIARLQREALKLRCHCPLAGHESYAFGTETPSHMTRAGFRRFWRV